MQINGKNVNVKRYSSFEERNVKNVNNVTESIRATRDDFNCADHLVRKFERLGCTDAEGCRNFFCKCSMYLTQDTIWSIFEKATTSASVKSPIKYFIGACRNQMK